MDSGEDFLTPEFLNILFFQQKNLVIYPYVDLKHLHTLEVFTAGYSHIDLESTALYDLKQVLELESESSYSQSPTFYFIYNIERSQVKEVLSMDNIRCVLNSNDAISDLADGGRFVFYNKKNNHFLNYSGRDLEFENHLISSAQSREVLYDSIQKIKSTASLIFAELNNNNSFANLPEILKDYDSQYWQKILNFTGSFFEVNVPKVGELDLNHQVKVNKKDNLQDFSDEYEVIVSTNKNIGKEFIQCLHEYRSKKVNASHLELEDMFNPLRLYNYLRNRHWKEGIPEIFLKEWASMNRSQYTLTEEDCDDFEAILRTLQIDIEILNLHQVSSHQRVERITKNKPVEMELLQKNKFTSIPSVRTDWPNFKQWMLDKIITLEKILGIKDISTYGVADVVVSLEQFNERLRSKLEHIFIEKWVGLYQYDDREKFLTRFITTIGILHDRLYGKDKKIDMPLKIKRLKFETSLEKKLKEINRIRNNIVHKGMTEEEINSLSDHTFSKIKESYFQLLVQLINKQIFSVVTQNKLGIKTDYIERARDSIIK
ncbi:MAG TPA: hypothetical protein ENI29_23130, partial [bacterium]|nr:hypothetical protein [bacterium]